MDISFRVEGATEARIGISQYQREIAEGVQELLERAAREALAEMRAKVPRSDEGGDSIAASLDIRVGEFHPGGPGGGGTREVIVGPGPDAPGHLAYVMLGTGIHGPSGNLIRPRAGGNLAIQKEGEGVRFRKWSRGQRPQREWVEDAQERVRLTVGEGIRRLERRLR